MRAWSAALVLGDAWRNQCLRPGSWLRPENVGSAVQAGMARSASLRTVMLGYASSFNQVAQSAACITFIHPAALLRGC